MSRTFLMKFSSDDSRDAVDRIGGIPAQRPETIPRNPHSGEELAFLAQFQIEPDKFQVKETLLVQIYQDPDFDSDRIPVAITIKETDPINTGYPGREYDGLPCLAIKWEERYEELERENEDEIYELPQEEFLLYLASKAGGCCYFRYVLEPEEIFLLQLNEKDIMERIFGGLNLILFINKKNEIQVRLG
ncbi:MAG: hypothetical protein R3C11_24170 [Planctomycetaceae bacterium]